MRQTTSENAYTLKLRLSGKLGLYQQTPRALTLENVMTVQPSSEAIRYLVNRSVVYQYIYIYAKYVRYASSITFGVMWWVNFEIISNIIFKYVEYYIFNN